MSHLGILICAPFWAATAVFALSMLRMMVAPIGQETWGEKTYVVVPLAVSAALVTFVVLAVMWL